MTKPTRKQALEFIKVAGYHNDKADFVRFYCEHRISYQAAQEAFRLGMKQKAAGVKCSCFQCEQTLTA